VRCCITVEGRNKRVSEKDASPWKGVAKEQECVASTMQHYGAGGRNVASM
jgi:hypothetical protein